MDIVTQTIIDVIKDLQDVEISYDDVHAGKQIADFGLDSIDSIELL